MAAVRATPEGQSASFLTQWSQVLDPLGDHSDTINKQRRVADLLEKGDEKAMVELKGEVIVAWTPSDPSALNRIISQFLRRTVADSPASIIFIAPLPFYPGVNMVSQYLDLWWHPLLGEKHASIVKNISLMTQPVEYVLPGPRGPKHLRQGLACFKLNRDGPRALPTLNTVKVPILHIAQSASFVIDAPTDSIPGLMNKLSQDMFSMLKVRSPYRSLGSTVISPRTSLDVIAPSGLSLMAVELLTRELKRHVIGRDMIIGNRDLYTSDDAMVMEFLNASIIFKAAQLCSEVIFLSADKALIRTSASTDTWVQLMDTFCKEGEHNIITKIRWKASKYGGRPWAVPTASSSALAASRRRKGKQGKEAQLTDFITEINVNGEIGISDKETIDELVKHVCAQTGIQLKAHSTNDKVAMGTWKHLASYDPAAPPGRARLYLGSQEEVRKIYSALHGQILQVGADSLSITVHNDYLEDVVLSGNGRGGR